MKRSLLAVGALFLALFGAVAALKRYQQEDREPIRGTEREGREHIRAFWEEFDAATAARGRADFGAAADRYRRALALNPRHEDSLFYLSVCLEELGKYAEAAASLRQLIEINPESNRAFSQLGDLLATLAPGAMPDFDAAAAAFSRNKEINYEESGPFLRLGLLELARGNMAKARESFSVAAGGGGPEGTFLLGLTDYLDRRDAAAVRTFVQVLEANEREKAVSGRGVFSEGDIQLSAGAGRLTAFERAGIKSLLFLYWTARRMGGYPSDVPDRFRLNRPERAEPWFVREALPRDPAGRAAWIDFDGDGRQDLLVAGPQAVALFRNGGDAWLEVTRETGLAGAAGAWEATVFDENGDGWQDFCLVRAGYIGEGKQSLYRNQQGRFREVTAERGLSGERPTARAVAADLDGDRRVDLLEVGAASSRLSPVRLFRNRAEGFVESSADLGLSYPSTAVDALTNDFDGDGENDLVILGWRAGARLFRGRGRGFTDMTATAGLGEVGGEGFSALSLDFDRDGRMDLLVTAHAPLELSLMRLLYPVLTSQRYTPRLFRNRGQGLFEEVTAALGLDRCYGIMQAASADFDRDGWPDVVFALGGLEKSHLEPGVILRNGVGKRFVEWTYLPGFDAPANASAAAVADWDGDGWPDVFLSGAGLFRNRGRK